MTATSTFRFWSSAPRFAVGCLAGLLLLLSLRVLYYDWMGFQPNMHPGIAFVSLPVLFPIVLAMALAIEAILHRFVSTPASGLQALCLGVIGASVVSWWAFPSHWYVAALLNPLLLRWAIPGLRRVRPNKTMEPTR